MLFHFLKKHMKIKNFIKLITVIFAVIFGINLALPIADAANELDPRITQVKTANSPTVYYLDRKHKMKKAYINSGIFLSYGNKFSKIKTISQKELNKWPEVKLVKTKTSSKVYYIKGNKKTLIINQADFKNFNFKDTDILTINQQELNAYLLTDYRNMGLINSPAGGGNYPDTPILSVNLDDQAPKNNFLPTKTEDNLIAVFGFYSDEKNIEIKKLTLTAKGIYNPNSINEITISDENNNFFDVPVSINNRNIILNFNSKPFKINSNRYSKLKIYAGFNDYPGVNNQTLQLSIEKPDDITANSEIEGNFPINAAEFKMISGKNAFAEIIAEKNPIKSDVLIGNTDKNIAKIRITETSGRENISIKKLEFINKGDAHDTDLKNFRLRDEKNKLLATAPTMTDQKIVFTLNGYKINKLSTVSFSVFADAVDGENHVVNLYLNDADIKGENSGYNLDTTFNNTDDNLRITRQSMKVLAKDFKDNGKVFNIQKGLVIGNFQLRNNNQKLILDSIDILAQKNSNPANLDRIYLVDFDSGKVYDQKAANGEIKLTFGNLILQPKKELNFSILTDSPEKLNEGDTYNSLIKKINYKNSDRLIFSENLNTSGNNTTLNRSNLYIYPNTNNKETTFVKGQKNIKLGSFYLENSAGDDLTIASISLAKGNESKNFINYANGFENLKVYLGGSRLKTDSDKNFNDTIIIDQLKYKLKSGSRTELVIFGDTQSDLNVDDVQLEITGISAGNNESGLPAAIIGTGTDSQKITFGRSTIELTSIKGGKIFADTKENNIATILIKNTGVETISLNSINLVTDGEGFSNSLGFENLSVRLDKRVLGNISKPVAGANKLSLSNYNLEAGKAAELTVYVNTDDSIASGTVQLYFSKLETTGRKTNTKISSTNPQSEKVKVEIDGGLNSNLTKLDWPTGGRRINYKFRDPKYPFKKIAEHEAIDIDASQGTDVKAAASGIIEVVIDGGADGYSYVVIKHNNTIETLYGHLSKISVKEGNAVKKGQVIGLSGGKPGTPGAGQYSTGAHLHFEVIVNGTKVNPQTYLK